MAGGVATVIVSSVFLLMLLSFPLGKAEVDANWYIWAFYAVVVSIAGRRYGGTLSVSVGPGERSLPWRCSRVGSWRLLPFGSRTGISKNDCRDRSQEL